MLGGLGTERATDLGLRHSDRYFASAVHDFLAAESRSMLGLSSRAGA
jgi:hypothetical protein